MDTAGIQTIQQTQCRKSLTDFPTRLLSYCSCPTIFPGPHPKRHSCSRSHTGAKSAAHQCGPTQFAVPWSSESPNSTRAMEDRRTHSIGSLLVRMRAIARASYAIWKCSRMFCSRPSASSLRHDSKSPVTRLFDELARNIPYMQSNGDARSCQGPAGSSQEASSALLVESLSSTPQQHEPGGYEA